MALKTSVFTFRVNDKERQLIEQLSKRLKRNQSDAVRFVILEAAEALINIEPNREPSRAVQP